MKALQLILFLTVYLRDPSVVAITQEFFIAAVETTWDYLNLDTTDPGANQRRFASGIQKFKKAVYTEYTDSSFTTQKSKPPWAGIQGPTIRAVVNDRVVIHFKNKASQNYSISPIGVPYWKQSEGAGYDDSSSVQEREDDAVLPGGYYKYVWDIHPNSGPTVTDPECLTYSYSSQVDIVRDFNSGLIGALLICKSGAVTGERERKTPEFVLLFAVFDENKSWYREISRGDKPRKTPSRQFHTINGYINSTLTGLKLCLKTPIIPWHLIGLGSTPDIHTIQFQDHTLKVMDHRRVTVDITPMTYTTALMKPSIEGKFLISCRIHSHQQAGMSAYFTVEDCPEPVELPDKRNVKHTEEEEEEEEEEGGDKDYSADDLFSTIVFQPGGPSSVLRSTGRGGPKVWVHYISAEEVTWDYNPQSDRSLGSDRSAKRWGKVYKKVVYVEYTDKTFTVRKSKGSTLIGPELTGEVEDQFQIIFKNKASRPYNIYPNGLASVHPLKKRSQEKQVDLRSLAVPPGEIMMYLWKLTPDDAPADADPRCLTRLYQSTVDPDRDVASGLVGPLIICKSQSLDKRGKVVTSDRERHLIFSVFDENKSWYLEENIQNYSEDPSKVDRYDPRFYSSNIKYSVNGFMNNSLQFKICAGDVTLWHVASVGIENDFLSVYFMGNPFEKDKTYGTVLTLFPMTGDTVTIEMETEGEWEIGAFDPVLKQRGMSVRYSVINCERVLPLADNEDEEYDFEDYIEQNFPVPRGFRDRNRTMAIRVCKRPPRNKTQTDLLAGHGNSSKETLGSEGRKNTLVCEIKLVPVEEAEDLDILSQGGIPQDILDQLDMEKGRSSSKHQRRSASGETVPETQDDQLFSGSHQTDLEVDDEEDLNLISTETNIIPTEKSKDEGEMVSGLRKNTSLDLFKQFLQRSGWNMTSDFSKPLDDLQEDPEAVLEPKSNLTERSRRETWGVSKEAGDIAIPKEALSDNDILKDEVLQIDKMAESLDPHKYPPKHRQPIPSSKAQDSLSSSSGNQTHPGKTLQVEYDDYESEGNDSVASFNTYGELDIRSPESRFRSYYIAAEEIFWNYGIDTPPHLISLREMRRGKRKFLSSYRKVVYRAYHDKEFQNPVKRGELDKHLGIMGPLIKAEVNDVLTVVFKNLATRPYSLQLHGVYDKTTGGFGPGQGSGAGLRDVQNPGDPVPPGEERVYNWRITKRQGPSAKDFDCKAGAYYSTVNMEKDINSGLIGPLLICRPGTLQSRAQLQPGVQDYFLLFTIFDEKKSWYLDYNLAKFCTPPCRGREDPWFETNNRFAAINGYVAETLPGLEVAQHQASRWHLLNVGGSGEFHAVHFHGIPFSVGKDQEHRLGVFNLYPGVFGTVELRPAIAGTWLVECTIGENQLSGMRAKLLVYNPFCIQPLGMQTGWITDDQITESDHYGYWEARLARLHLSGSINAWIGNGKASWIQVDLLRPMLVHGIQTQGVKTSMHMNKMSIVTFTISYSLDQKTWRVYKGNSSESVYKFNGNMESYNIKENIFTPPIIGQYIRIHPLTYNNRPALRFELLGCDLNSCSFPLGMQRKQIPNSRISASSYHQSWMLSWSPDLARLNQEGRANAWRPKSNNPHEWLQVDFDVVKRVTAILTQGARSMLTHMMVTEFTVSVSDDGRAWSTVMEQGMKQAKIFEGNMDYDEEKLNLLEPPLFTRFIRIHPKGWINDIALRVEFLGCDTQQRL